MNVNDGINTGIHFAAKTNDATFSYVGSFPAINQKTTPMIWASIRRPNLYR